MLFEKMLLTSAIVALAGGFLAKMVTAQLPDQTWNISYTSKQIKDGFAVQYRDGDILIGVMIPQHVATVQKTCGEVEPFGVQYLEAVNMLIEKINANDTILPGIKLGTLALDTCTSDTHTVRMLLPRCICRFDTNHCSAAKIVRETFEYYTGASDGCSAKEINRTRTGKRGKHFAGFVGASESSVTILSSKILRVFSMPQVSYLSTNHELSNKKIYPYVFRTVPSDKHQAEAMVKFVERNGWNFISVVYSDTLYGSRAFSQIKAQASSKGICIDAQVAIPLSSADEVYIRAVEKLSEQPFARVVIVFAVIKEAEKLLLAAENSSITRDQFLWIASDGWTSQLPVEKNDYSYVRQLRRTIGFMPEALPTPQLDTYFRNLQLKDRSGSNRILNPWFIPYFTKHRGCSLTGNGTKNISCSPEDRLEAKDYHVAPFAHYLFDAVQVFAQALHRLHKDFCRGKRGLCPDLKCGAGTNKLATEILPYLRNVSIVEAEGGHFKFDKNQDGKATYEVQTYGRIYPDHVDRWHRVGLFDKHEFKLNQSLLKEKLKNLQSVCSKPCRLGERKHTSDNKVCCWTCIPCKSDEIVRNETQCIKCLITEMPNNFRNECVTLEQIQTQLSSPYLMVPLVISILGLVLSICVIVVYVIHRDTPIVKACSKELTVFVFAGIIICLLDGCIVSRRLSPASCISARVFLSLGPAFMYSGLLTKTLRIAIIFQSKKVLQTHLKEYIRPMPQIVTTVVLIILQVFVLTTWFLITPNSAVYSRIGRQMFYDCSGLKDSQILIALAYPSVLIIACTVLATINRHVPDGFNEARYMGFTMYTTCVIWLAFVSIVLLNTEKVPLKIMTTSICLSLSAYTVLAWMFLPRCYVIIWQPERNTKQCVMARNPTHLRNKERSKQDATNSLTSDKTPTTSSGKRATGGDGGVCAETTWTT